MTYREAIIFLYESLPMYQRTGKAAYKADLQNTLRLDEYFNEPHRKFRSVHIAGTNGKGSVSHMLASIFQEAGYLTGLYTSPHLLDFRERIRINGRMIPENEVVNFVEEHRKIIDEVSPSFFEMTVAMAFSYFADKKVEFAVIETGLGGRLDSTKSVNPEVSVITNISMDHTEFLGNNITAIAGEKAGIIKQGVPVVVGKKDRDTDNVFIQKASVNNAEICFAPERYSTDFSMYIMNEKRAFHVTRRSDSETWTIETDLAGDYQSENILTTLSTIDTLRGKGVNIPEQAIFQGLKKVTTNTGLRGRWEVIGHNPRIVCDTGHNEEGIRCVVNQLSNTPWKTLHMVLGFVNDKDIGSILKILPKDAIYYFTGSSVPRSLDGESLRKRAMELDLKGSSFKSVEDAFITAKKSAASEDMIFVGGSTFVVADLLKLIG